MALKRSTVVYSRLLHVVASLCVLGAFDAAQARPVRLKLGASHHVRAIKVPKVRYTKAKPIKLKTGKGH
jgi:hypothetical protein